jgi:hypothetical protein
MQIPDAQEFTDGVAVASYRGRRPLTAARLRKSLGVMTLALHNRDVDLDLVAPARMEGRLGDHNLDHVCNQVAARGLDRSRCEGRDRRVRVPETLTRGIPENLAG